MSEARDVVVTGATGFIGRHVVRALLGAGRRVVALCRPSGAGRLPSHARLRVVPFDLRRPEPCRQELREAVVIHLAALRHLRGAPRAFDDVNLRGTLAFARLCVEARTRRLVHVSTAYVYGPSGAAVTSESSPLPPVGGGGYLQSRIAALLEMRRLGAAGLPLVTLCPTIVFGPDSSDHPNVITQQLRRMLRLGVNLVVDGGRLQRNLVYVDDVVRGILLAEGRDDLLGEELILGGEHCTHRRFNQLAFALAGKRPCLCLSVPSSLVCRAARLGDRLRGWGSGAGYESLAAALTAEWRFSSNKAAARLGYTFTPLASALSTTLAAIGRAA
jgi:dihydroflavonol-4-reductase